jgi:hypothetical protein
LLCFSGGLISQVRIFRRFDQPGSTFQAVYSLGVSLLRVLSSKSQLF